MKLLLKTGFRQFPFWLLLTIWAVYIIEQLLQEHFSWLGVHPRHFSEWYTFLTGALVHSDFEHLFHNSYPLLLLGIFIYFLFERFSNIVFLASYLLAGLFIFLFARSTTYHVGASGVAYSWAFLLAASGFFRKDRISLGLGLLVALLYGSMIWGIFPIQQGVSWDGHLYGAISGIIIAYLFRNVNVKERDNSEVEETEEYNQLPEQFRSTRFEYLKRQFSNEEE